MKYFHVDVFSPSPLSGNGLIVLFPKKILQDQEMLRITQEMRQFESVFIYPKNRSGVYPLRIFTAQEELPFAGHPVLGAAAVLHHIYFSSSVAVRIPLNLHGRAMSVESRRSGQAYSITMNQGFPWFIQQVETKHNKEIAAALNLSAADLVQDMPIEVISTGLPYLIVPVRSNRLAEAGVKRKDFEAFLQGFGAKFVYVFDPKSLVCRTWDNSGLTEDIATGSAAGPLCAYLVKNGIKKEAEIIRIRQGQYVGRPSVIEGWMEGGEVFIRGEVSIFATGTIKL